MTQITRPIIVRPRLIDPNENSEQQNKKRIEEERAPQQMTLTEVLTAGNNRRIRTFDPFVKSQVKFLPR